MNKCLSINFFTEIKTKFGSQYLIYNKKYNVTYYSNSQIYAYLHTFINNLLTKDGYYYKDDQLSEIAKFKIISIEENHASLKFLNKESVYKKSTIPLSSDDEQ